MVKAEANKAVDKLHIREAIVVEGRDDVDAKGGIWEIYPLFCVLSLGLFLEI